MANLPILFNRWINAEWTTSHYLQDRPGTLTYFTCARGLWLLYGCYYDPTHNILPDNNSELWSYSQESKLVPTTETTYNLGLLYFKTSYILQEDSLWLRELQGVSSTSPLQTPTLQGVTTRATPSQQFFTRDASEEPTSPRTGICRGFFVDKFTSTKRSLEERRY